MKKVIALDIGGTNTRVALVNEAYEIESELIYDTVGNDVGAFLENVAKVIVDGVKSFDDVVAISAGVPGRVRVDGFIDALPNVGINDVPLREFLENRFHLPAFVANDAEVASLAEANVGPLKDNPSLYFVTISTGVGGALTRQGKLIHSSYEVGHTLTEYQGKLYEFEHLASGTGLVLLSSLNNLNVKNAKEFFHLVKAKDPLALKVKKDWISLLSGWISLIQETFNPKVYALTGGVMKSAELFYEDLKASCPNSKLEFAGCGQRAGLYGAAVLGFQKAR